MHIPFDETERWRARYEEELPIRAARMLNRLDGDRLASSDVSWRREQLVRYFGYAERRDWLADLAAVERITPRSAVQRIAFFELLVFVEGVTVTLCGLVADVGVDLTGDRRQRRDSAAARFVAHALTLPAPIAASESVGAFRSAVDEVANALELPPDEDVAATMVRAGGEALRLSYVAEIGSHGYGLPKPIVVLPPSALAEREAYLIDTFDESDDRYWEGKPEATGLIVVPRDEAVRLADFRRALSEAECWSDLTGRIGDPKTWEHIMEEFEHNELPDVPIDLQDVGDEFITDPKQAMLGWLPKSVQWLGTIVDAGTESAWLHLPESSFDDVVEALAVEGYDAFRDPGDDVKWTLR